MSLTVGAGDTGQEKYVDSGMAVPTIASKSGLIDNPPGNVIM